ARAEDRRRVARGADAGAVRGAAPQRHRAALHREVRPQPRRRHVPLRRLWGAAVRLRHEVRLRHGLAELHVAGARRERDHGGRPLARHASHRGHVCALRRPSRARVPRRSRPDRPAVLHQLVLPRLQRGDRRHVVTHVIRTAQPTLREPVVLAAFEGWNDAGEAATFAARFLVERWGAEPFATLDPEEFFGFTSTRPQVQLDDEGQREIVWPATTLFSATVPGTELDVLFVIGSEPQLRWRTFCTE